MFFKSTNAPTWLVVFLGNPGLQYEGTRHNAGFMTGDALAKSLNAEINRSKFKALTAVCKIGSESVMLMKPQTYMNLSGEAVIQAVNFYKIPPEHVIVVSDEMSLPIGSLRVRMKGSAGGHNGLKNIISHLGGDGFPRIKVGVGEKPHPDSDMVDWVLGKFTGQDRKVMEETISRAADCVECLLAEGVDAAMARFNGQ